jgi:thiamine pyrophosphate-dependent acetolactate synthase large subunit-like protein
MLRSGRPGPVILAIPNATATYDETADPYRPVKGWKSAPDPGDVRAAVDQLLQARNPLIYAGEGVIYAGASEDLKALAELVNVPVRTLPFMFKPELGVEEIRELSGALE